MVCAGCCHVPLKPLLPDRGHEGASLGPLFTFVFTAMVSIGLAGAHVQPVLEKISATSLLAASY